MCTSFATFMMPDWKAALNLQARKFFARARKFLTTAEKIFAKFDVFCLRHFML